MPGLRWDRVRRALALRPAARLGEPVSTRAAVAAVLREAAPANETSELELLFIRRAEHERDPWSGHVSFPGGRSEAGESLLDTAIRETAEETGLDLRADGEALGALDEVRAMARGRPVDLAISPFVFRLRGAAAGTPTAEVVSLHWLPLPRLLDARDRSTVEYRHEGTTLHLPCLRIGELVIWGLTYRMLENLRELLLAAGA
jgi:8-oxo-dGTP pyrophosphatase MutT (NUDIX family)